MLDHNIWTFPLDFDTVSYFIINTERSRSHGKSHNQPGFKNVRRHAADAETLRKTGAYPDVAPGGLRLSNLRRGGTAGIAADHYSEEAAHPLKTDRCYSAGSGSERIPASSAGKSQSAGRRNRFPRSDPQYPEAVYRSSGQKSEDKSPL